MKSAVLDSYALLAFLEDEPGAEKVQRFFEQADRSRMELFMSVVNWGEVYYSLCRSKGAARAEEALLIIEQLPVRLLDVTRDFMRRVAHLKANHAVAPGDCFAAALAVERDCPVVTGDREFRKLGNFVKVEWL